MSETERAGPLQSARARSPVWRQHLGAFAVYLVPWLAITLPGIATHLHDHVLSNFPQEASPMVWSLAWWSRGATYLSNPLVSTSIWAPSGINLAWVTTIPGPSIVAVPMTRLLGPIAAFNVLALLTPPLSAWTAYLLARRITTAFWPSVVGGALFGFSPFVTREILLGHLNLSLVFLIPLAAYLVIRRFDGTLGRASFVLLLTLVLVAQFSIFIEVFATMAVMAALVGLVAFLVASKDIRRRIVETAALVAVAFALTGLLIAPYLWTAAVYPNAAKPAGFSGLAQGAERASDLTRYVRPGRTLALSLGRLSDLNFWYFGIPLLGIVGAFWFHQRRSFGPRVLAIGFLIAVVLALGSPLHLAGQLVRLPWAVFARLPLIERARPGRIIVYAYLFASLSAAMWLAQARIGWRSVARWVAGGLAVATFVPNVVGSGWTREAALPDFFSTGQYRNYLCPGEIILVSDQGPTREAYWQAQTGMYFRTATWYPGFLPANYADLPTGLKLLRGRIAPDDALAVSRFLEAHDVSVVIIGHMTPERKQRLEAFLTSLPQPVGGLTLIRVAPCPGSL
jgi:hypothetical protein